MRTSCIYVCVPLCAYAPVDERRNANKGDTASVHRAVYKKAREAEQIPACACAQVYRPVWSKKWLI